MGSSLKKHFIIYLVCSVFIPIFLCGYFVTSWMDSNEKNLQTLEQMRISDNKAAVLRILAKVEATCTNLLQSRELADFLHAAEDTRTYLSSLLYARVLNLNRQTPEISGWQVYDRDGYLLFSYGLEFKHSFDKKPGFSIGSDVIALMSKIFYDDQYMEQSRSDFFGYVIVTFKIEDLIKQVPSLAGILSIDALHTDKIQIKLKNVVHNSNGFLFLLLIMSIVLLFSLGLGGYLVRAKFFNPIQKLTEEVKGKANLTLTIRNGNEILLLREAFEAYCAEIERQSNLVAIAKTTQMIAHDIKKPFSSLTSLLDLLHVTEDDSKLRQLVAKYIPLIESSAMRVDSLVENILEAGREIQLKLTSVSLKSTVKDALTSVFHFNSSSRIQLMFDFHHTNCIRGDKEKILRVIENIIANAVDALDGRGKLWIRSKDSLIAEQCYVEVCIGNNGRLINAKDLPNVFEPFFTKKKAGGVGLGLAICRKIIEAHSGEIWCRSDSNVGTEFFCRLASDEFEDNSNAIFPDSSANFNAAIFKDSHDEDKTVLQETSREFLVEFDIPLQSFREFKDRNFSLLLVDDEDLYSSLVGRYILESAQLREYIDITTITTVKDSFQVPVHSCDLAIIDVDLADTYLDGFDLVQLFRKEKQMEGFICVHSNRGLSEYQDRAHIAGADFFLPKPMTRVHLLKLLKTALEKALAVEQEAVTLET